jgi:uncharacterized membrane protein YhaH (DUF805 family)
MRDFHPLDLRRGRVTGPTFLAAGVVLFATKFAIDYAVAHFLFHRHWSLIEYLAPGQAVASLISDRAGRAFYLTMTAIALPYVLVGLSLTMQRLRDAALPRWLVVLFFLPVGNVIFFLAIGVLASKDDAPPATASPALSETPLPPPARPAATLDYGLEIDGTLYPRWGVARWWPRSDGASKILAILLPIPVLALALVLATHVLRDYGWGVFIGLPFVNGMLAALFHGTRTPRSVGESMGVAALAVIASCAAVFLVALEGLGCLVMFLPLAIPMGLIGAAVGHAIQARPLPASPGDAWRVQCSLLAILPLLMLGEHAAAPPAPTYAVTTVVDVDAPPDRVWQHVVAFPDLAPPTDWLFRAGVAYPIRARIDGQGPGATRYCEFSTGAFVEPIETWEPGRLLKFSVSHNPPAMREWSFWPDVRTPHVDGFLVSDGGQFHLVPLEGGRRTRLEGTTWYRHHLWPAAYWRLWSDQIIHRIHTRVLEHVKTLSEASSPSP